MWPTARGGVRAERVHVPGSSGAKEEEAACAWPGRGGEEGGAWPFHGPLARGEGLGLLPAWAVMAVGAGLTCLS